MSIEFTGKTTIFRDGDRVCIGLSGEGLSDGTRLSTKIENKVGQELDKLLTSRQLDEFANTLNSTFVRAHADAQTLVIQLNTVTATALIRADGGDLKLIIKGENLTSAQISQLVDIAIRAARRIESWRSLSLLSDHPLAHDLLTVADTRHQLRFDPVNFFSLEFEDANLYLSSHGKPAVLLTEDVQEKSWRQARDLIHKMPSQKDAALIVHAQTDGDTTKLFEEMKKAKRTMFYLTFHNETGDRLSVHCPKTGESWTARCIIAEFGDLQLSQVHHYLDATTPASRSRLEFLSVLLQDYYAGRGEPRSVQIMPEQKSKPSLGEVVNSLKGERAEEAIMAHFQAAGFTISRS